MSPAKSDLPTYPEIIADFLRSATGPVPVAKLAQHIAAVRPPRSKNPRPLVRQHIREAEGSLLVFLDADNVLPLRLAINGARFRGSLDRHVVTTGLVGLGEILSSYLPPRFPLERVRLVSVTGQPIAFETRKISEKVNGLFGPTTVESVNADLSAWFRAEKLTARDQLHFTIVDWEQGLIRLEREPFKQLDPARRAERNRLLADLFYDLLESAASEMLMAQNAVPTVYARLPDKSGYPPDHWLAVVAGDERLDTDGWLIRYREGQSSLLDLLGPDPTGEPRPAASQPASKEQRAQVYRFKAALAHRPSLWRTIEIQGKQSLADLDLTLRVAFQHDTMDHLGGFWKLVPRGGAASKPSGKRPSRYREIELGDVDPEGGGTGARQKIAGLGLVAGVRLKYVYDFGDWIEHQLTLEAIEAPQPRVRYPREVARNQPQFAYCVECKSQGRHTVAKWICIECSDNRNEKILLCEDCADENHEDHYGEEVLY